MVTAAGVPLTVLSGFLGSGKTTLLQKILKNKEGIKCAVIVNDFASVNVDANIISKTVKGDDTLLHMENGCACCTLNAELVQNLVSLAKSEAYDYILVENSGVADPEGVAEPLVDPATLLSNEQKLMDLVKLDTCLTVVDASTFFKYLNEGKAMADSELCDQGCEHGDHEPQDCSETEVLICQLLVQQIEYSDVVALNKTDMVPADKLQQVLKAIKAINPKADVIPCSYGDMELKQVLGTGKYNKQKFAERPVVKHDEGQKHFEDAVSSFVYTSRQPFHPERLHCFLTKHFDLRQRDWTEEIKENQETAMSTIKHASKAIAAAAAVLPHQHAALRKAAEAVVTAADSALAEVEDAENTPDAALLATAQAGQVQLPKEKPFGQLLRSKGQAWIAGPSRHDHLGEWSSAGDVLQLTSGGPWAAMLPVKYWPEDQEKREMMLQDFVPGVGDRRQELVFIGLELNEKKIREELDKCLCTPWEWLQVQQGGFELEDPFVQWPAIAALLPVDEEEGEGEEEEGDDDMATTVDLAKILPDEDDEHMDEA